MTPTPAHQQEAETVAKALSYALVQKARHSDFTSESLTEQGKDFILKFLNLPALLAARDELARIDETLARRPALADEPSRQAKIEKAINVAKQVDQLRAELAHIKVFFPASSRPASTEVRAMKAALLKLQTHNALLLAVARAARPTICFNEVRPSDVEFIMNAERGRIFGEVSIGKARDLFNALTAAKEGGAL